MTVYSCKRMKKSTFVDLKTDKTSLLIKTRIAVFESFKLDTV